MASWNPQLSGERLGNPARWQRRVRAAIDKEDDNLYRAAISLGVSYETLRRWCGELRIDRGGPGPKKRRLPLDYSHGRV